MNRHRGNGSQLSSINPTPENNNDSIINQLNLLDNGTFESRVVKVESFIYAHEQRSPESPYQHLHDSFLHDLQGNIIPPIASRKVSPYNMGSTSPFKLNKQNDRSDHKPNFSSIPVKDDKSKGKKSIREEIMQQNQMLQRRLSHNKNYIPSFSSQRQHINIYNDAQGIMPATTKELHWENIRSCMKIDEINLQSRLDDEFLGKLEEQYNKSKVIKLYNFIMRELPRCSLCQGYRAHLSKQAVGVSFKCKECDQQSSTRHPLIGILYDLENKSRFQEEIAAYQTVLDKINDQINALKDKIASLETFKEKLVGLKNLNRKKYKQINESKFYLKKHLGNLQQSHLIQLQKLIPREYLQQMEMWSDIKEKYKPFIDASLTQIYKIMPVHLHQQTNSKFISNLHKILNYQSQQAVKISISQHIKFPLKKIESAVFVVDGSYNLPVFQNINHLHLQFQNKKTLRQLNLLFTNFPREIHSLSFNYNHKIHSHISAESFPFLKFITTIPSIKKMHVGVENMKDFTDVFEMGSIMTPKLQLKLTVTKHIFSKSQLNLPQNYYINLIGKLGSQVTKLELDLPESNDSPAVIDYEQLMELRYLAVFKINRGDKDSKDVKKMKILEELDSSDGDKKKKLIFKKCIANRLNFLRTIKKLHQTRCKDAVRPILSFLL